MIGEFGSSETVCSHFFPQNKAFNYWPPEMLLQGVIAKTNLPRSVVKLLGLPSLSAAKTRSSKTSITGPNKRNQNYNNF